jgi:hypothetical protein
MNITIRPYVIRLPKLNTPLALLVSIRSHANAAKRRALRKLFGPPVLGNPLHEAWSVDGEPLERMTPDQLAKKSPTRYLIAPHNRGQ